MKKGWTILFATLVILSLTACGQKNGTEVDSTTEITQENTKATEPTTEIASTEQTTPADTAQTESKTWDGYEDNFAVESETVAAYAKLIKEAIAEKDIEKLADLTFFPVYVALSENPVVNTREEFIALDTEKLFSEEMLTSIADADESSLSPSMAGFTLCGSNGAPSITFGVQDGKLGIKGIN